ncbi:MAG: serine--tRNA ligase [Candidatus Levybacteria bacterium CG2_30_37_29]|nr:MAG: serine--tRNA ligase [Candidatus Levybacteria bacterium CG2_30_37_29]
MLDLKFIRENAEKVQKSSKDKGIDVDIQELLRLDEEHRTLFSQVQNLYSQRNVAAKERNVEKGKSLKSEISTKETRLLDLKNELDTLLYSIPNPAKDDVKIGKDESENEIVKTVGTPKKFGFKPKDHLELGESLDIIDIQRAAKVSGARFAYLKNEGVLLEFALQQFAFDTLVKEGFIPVIPPVLIKKSVMKGLGYMENGGDEDMYHLEKDGLVLVGTAEHALVPLHMDETFQKKDLPRRYVGFSPAFRRESGSYGKDTRGIFRVHQFNKVEMVSFVAGEDDDNEHAFLLDLEEKFFQALDIPYQVVKMCTGDLGFPAARKYDIEAWMPTQEKYREVTSCSTTTDFQSRRLNTKYLPAGRQGLVGSDKKFVQILNGTAFAVGRTIIAILENYQEEDGSVVIPEVLRKYTNYVKKISPILK